MEQQSSPDSQLDVIVAVKESLIDNWHLENLRMNPTHYSTISRLFGSQFILYLQKIPPSFSYHPFIQVENTNQLFKYGVITTEDLIHDLKTWENLYSAGRLQKPIATLPFGDFDDKERIDQAMQLNYLSAVAVALIMLPDQFTKSQLYKTITSISYMGDVRSKIAENPQKINNIVEGSPQNLIEFDTIYENALNRFMERDVISYSSPDNHLTLHKVRELNMNEIKEFVPSIVFDPSINLSKEEDSNDIEFIRTIVIQNISAINKRYSFAQSLKGVISAGLLKSFRYGLHKVKKKFANNS